MPVQGLNEGAFAANSSGSATLINVKKGFWHGLVAAGVTSMVQGFYASHAANPGKSGTFPYKFLSSKQYFRHFGTAFKAGALPIMGALTGFYVVRGMYEQGKAGRADTFLVPLAAVGAPALAMAATGKAVPAAYLAGLCFCLGAHLRDRVVFVRHDPGFMTGRMG
jgi:hypothetical protein